MIIIKSLPIIFHNRSFLLTAFKFGIVGFSGVFIDFTITYYLKEIIELPLFLSNSFGFIIAATSNYIINRIWTYKSNDNNILIESLRFLLIALIGLIINFCIIYLLLDLKLTFYLSKAISIIIVFVWNFSANHFFNFKHRFSKI